MDTLEELLWENHRLFRALATAADEALAPLEIRASERALLEFLAREPKPVSLSELARRHSVSRQHIQQTMRRLKRHWIETSADPDDARSLLVRLSDEGRSFWNEI